MHGVRIFVGQWLEYVELIACKGLWNEWLRGFVGYTIYGLSSHFYFTICKRHDCPSFFSSLLYIRT